jgi:hypothetical protein
MDWRRERGWERGVGASPLGGLAVFFRGVYTACNPGHIIPAGN